MSRENSWILKINSYLNLYSFKNFIIKRSHLFGPKISDWLINLGYLIKCSEFFHESKIPIHNDRVSHYNYLIDKFDLEQKCILYLEFGVYRGKSFEYWLKINENSKSRFIGFDTFSGLPEDWGHLKAGTFDTKGQIPTFQDERYEFKKGLFQETLPKFIEGNQNLLNYPLIINLDADLYSSTLYTLVKLSPYLKQGDILTFDEFFSVVNASTEFRAFKDFTAISNFEYKVISKSSTYCAIVIE